MRRCFWALALLTGCLDLGDLERTNPFDDQSTRDFDGDGVPNNKDAFPTDPHEWADTDGDGEGDNADNCPLIANTAQRDIDEDNIGDPCDPDRDGDGVNNELDLYPDDPNESADTDADELPDNQDNCPLLANPQQEDLDDDGIGDVCDPDRDGDGLNNDDDCAPDIDNRVSCGTCGSGTQECQGTDLVCEDPVSGDPEPSTACGGVCASATYRCSADGSATECVDPWQGEAVCRRCEASTWSWLSGSNWSQASSFELTDEGDGTVIDARTGLVWTLCPLAQDPITCASPAEFLDGDALDACAALTLNGRIWRLPRADEMLTLVSFTNGSLAPPFAAYSPAWVQRGNGLAWLTSDGEILSPSIAGGKAVVRCVSEGATPGPVPLAAARALKTAPGVFEDAVTGLMWSQVGQPGAHSGSACDALTVGGAGDWRLPAAYELASLMNWCGAMSVHAQNSLAPDGYFDLPSGLVWSATTVGTQHAWALDTENVQWRRLGSSSLARVLCVRGP